MSTNKDLAPYITKAFNNDLLLPGAANPCGLIARSFFSDKFNLYGPFNDTTLDDTNAACCSYNSTSSNLFMPTNLCASNIDKTAT